MPHQRIQLTQTLVKVVRFDSPFWTPQTGTFLEITQLIYDSLNVNDTVVTTRGRGLGCRITKLIGKTICNV